jgi:tetratricopeptide (TPR) repeat protein
MKVCSLLRQSAALAALVYVLAACAPAVTPVPPVPSPLAPVAAEPRLGDSRQLLAQAVVLLKDENAFDPGWALELLDGLAAREGEPTVAASARVLRVLALRLLGRYPEAVAAANALLLAQGPAALPQAFAPDVFVERGAALALLERPDRAREDFDHALLLRPGHVGALLARGDLAFAQGNAAGAEADYGRALTEDPRETQAWVNRGVVRDEQGRFAEAVADFTEALRRNPALPGAYANRGIALSQLGDMVGMCRDYQAACRLGACARLNAGRELGYCLP